VPKEVVPKDLVVKTNELTGDELVRVLSSLGSPHRMRVLAALHGGRRHVSGLARDLGISRALLQVHLKKLEKVGLVSSELELSDDGKAMKFYEVSSFALHLTPESIANAAATLTDVDAVDRSNDNGSE
jgi:DNA-binding transcriptional ArsR family regulator